MCLQTIKSLFIKEADFWLDQLARIGIFEKVEALAKQVYNSRAIAEDGETYGTVSYSAYTNTSLTNKGCTNGKCFYEGINIIQLCAAIREIICSLPVYWFVLFVYDTISDISTAELEKTENGLGVSRRKSGALSEHVRRTFVQVAVDSRDETVAVFYGCCFLCVFFIRGA